MGAEVVRLTATDFEEGMDFLNFVFGAHGAHDFEHMIPAIYRRTDEDMANNYAVKVDGRIRGIVGLFPMSLHVGERTLKVGGIGGVSTHPRSRGAGYMKDLMHACLERLQRDGFHLSYLGGQRQRYQYFGYERCGSAASHSLNRANLRHNFHDDPGVRFEKLEAVQAARLEQARSLHDGQRAHCGRPSGIFFDRLRNWHNQPHAALDGDGRMVGYLVANGRGDRVVELVGQDEATELRMLRAWVTDGSPGDAGIDLPLWRTGLSRQLARCGERSSLVPTGNWQPFAWDAVVDALLELRRQTGPMLPGSVVLAVEGGPTLRLEVTGDAATCTLTEDEPALRLDRFAAMRLLFGPLPASQTAHLPPAAAVLEQWCPLPLHWPGQDGV